MYPTDFCAHCQAAGIFRVLLLNPSFVNVITNLNGYRILRICENRVSKSLPFGKDLAKSRSPVRNFKFVYNSLLDYRRGWFIMDFMELYAQKRMTAAQAAALVKSGDWVDYG